MTDPEKTFASEVTALRQELTKLNSHRIVRINNSMWKVLASQFLRGLAFGLGTVVGATILVSLLGLFLSTIDFIPIIGEWATEIARQINQPR